MQRVLTWNSQINVVYKMQIFKALYIENCSTLSGQKELLQIVWEVQQVLPNLSNGTFCIDISTLHKSYILGLILYTLFSIIYTLLYTQNVLQKCTIESNSYLYSSLYSSLYSKRTIENVLLKARQTYRQTDTVFPRGRSQPLRGSRPNKDYQGSLQSFPRT